MKKYNNIQELKFQKKIKKIINKFEFILSDYGHGLISDQVAKILTKNQDF